MKTLSFKKLLACIMALLVLMTSLSVGMATALTEGDFEYSIDTEYDDDFNAIKSIKITKYNGNAADVVIPDKIEDLPVTIIGSSAFANNTSIKSVKIPETVVEIGGWAFDNCSNLTNINLSANLETIGGYLLSNTAFEKDGNNWDGELLYLDNYLLNSTDQAAGDITIKDGTKIVSGFAFSHNPNITSVKIPASVKTIDICAFDQCSSLSSVTLSEGLETIGYAAFENTAITEINIPNSVKTVESLAFSHTAIESVNLSANLEKVDGDSFANCPNLKSINVDSSNPVFYSTDGILFEKSQFDFMGDTLMVYPSAKEGTTYSVPENVEYLGYNTFAGLVYLKELNIPASVRSMSLASKTNLEKINIADDHESYKSVDGVVFSKDGSTILYYPDGKKGDKYEVTSGTKEAAYGSISYNNNLKELTFPEGFEKIERSAVYGCENLETINLPSTLTELEDNFTGYCLNLTTINFNGTKAQWEALGTKVSGYYDKDINLVCTDGTILLVKGNEEPTFTTEPTEPSTSTDATEPVVTNPTTPAVTEPSEGNTTATNPAESEFEIGDVNMDKKLNIKDATTIQKYLANIVTLDETALKLADFTQDGKVNIKDTSNIQKRLAGII